jgi:methionyl-tRNA formyltransferase
MEGESLVAVYTQPDKKVGRKQILTPPKIKVLAEEAGVPVFQPETFRKNEKALADLKDLQPDLVVVMAYGQILPQAVLETPRIACVNLHASLLPRHRGASPIQAAIREGDGETGITLMHVVAKLDAGDMILKKTLPIRSEDTGGVLHDRLADLGPDVLAEGLPRLREGDVAAERQDESLVTYAGKLEREDGALDWTQPAEEIERLIRAYDPWPGTFTTVLHGERRTKMKVFPPTRIGPDTDAPSGTILGTVDGLLVACGEGSIQLCGELQAEGRKRLPVEDFLRGIDLPEGTRLGA